MMTRVVPAKPVDRFTNTSLQHPCRRSVSGLRVKRWTSSPGSRTTFRWASCGELKISLQHFSIQKSVVRSPHNFAARRAEHERFLDGASCIEERLVLNRKSQFCPRRSRQATTDLKKSLSTTLPDQVYDLVAARIVDLSE